MATSSIQSTSLAFRIRARKRPDLELIVCHKYVLHTVEEFEAKTNEHGNQGRIFFKCPARNWDSSGCKFWYWEEGYEKLLVKLAREKEQQLQELARKEELKEAVRQKEEHMVQDGDGQTNEDDLGEQIRNLVLVVKEIVMVMKIMIFVAICGIVLNAYGVLRG